jgi:hypothetical protein
MTEPKLDRPHAHEVFQRQNGRADVPIRIEGLAEPTAEVLVLGPGRRVVARQEWPVVEGAAQGVVTVPEGGWYTVALQQDRRPLRLGKFGVGDVFVVAGQSNAAGHGDGFIADRTKMVSVWSDPTQWRLADKPEGMPGGMGAGSPWPVLGELLALSEGVPIGFINVAVGGTSTEQWQPGGELYAGLKQALTGRLVRAVLWHQGESDQISGCTTEQTYQNMEKIINQSRQDAGWVVPWYVALVSHTPDVSQEARDRTREGQKLLYKMGLALPGPDTDLYVPESMRYDRLHFGAVGLEVHAILWFRALHFARA